MKGIRQSDERKDRNVQRVLESLAAGLVIRPAQFITPGKRNRMNEHIDLAKMLCGFFCCCSNLFIFCNITFFHPLTAYFFRQWFYTALEHFASVTDADICTFAMKR